MHCIRAFGAKRSAGVRCVVLLSGSAPPFVMRNIAVEPFNSVPTSMVSNDSFRGRGNLPSWPKICLSYALPTKAQPSTSRRFLVDSSKIDPPIAERSFRIPKDMQAGGSRFKQVVKNIPSGLVSPQTKTAPNEIITNKW